MNASLKAMLPTSFRQFARLTKERLTLSMVRRSTGDPTASAAVSQLALDEIFRSRQYVEEWTAVQREIEGLSITAEAYGVNPGDRRALYYLIRHLRPRNVLEVGTHIGASTAYICAAMRRTHGEQPGETFHLTTVDIHDVNDPIGKPWLRSGTRYSPADVVARLGCGPMVKFVAENSLSFLARDTNTYDFIFLDGDHAAVTNYQEIDLALRHLNPNGYILLHDYFPNLKPLWSDGSIIPGPFLAAQRHQSEGAALSVRPLGALPWPTKRDSHVTSLAVLGRNSG